MHTAIGRFLQYLLVERNASDLTIKSYREDLTALGRLSHRSPRRHAARSRVEISVLDLRGYVASSARGGLRADHHRPPSRLAAEFFRFGQQGGPRPIRPSRCVIPASRGICRTSFPPKTSAICCNRRRPTRPRGLRDRAILETLYSAGLRVSELAGLNDSDLDFSGMLLRVRGKGRREQLVPHRLLRRAGPARWLGVRKLSPREDSGASAPCLSTSRAAASPRGASRGCWRSI